MATKPAPAPAVAREPQVNPAVVAARQDALALSRAGIACGMTQEQIDARLAAVLNVPLHV